MSINTHSLPFYWYSIIPITKQTANFLTLLAHINIVYFSYSTCTYQYTYNVVNTAYLSDSPRDPPVHHRLSPRFPLPLLPHTAVLSGAPLWKQNKTHGRVPFHIGIHCTYTESESTENFRLLALCILCLPLFHWHLWVSSRVEQGATTKCFIQKHLRKRIQKLTKINTA